MMPIPSSTQNRQGADAIIIGGGIVGSSAALALRKRGLSVILLERDWCGSRSSGINYGGVRKQGRALCQLPLAQRAHEIWGRLASIIGIDGEYQRTGHFKIARSEADMQLLVEYEAQSRAYGLELQLIDGAQLHRSHPWLGGTIVGGSLCPDDGQANPRLVSPAFARAAAAAGAQIHEREEAISVEHDGRDFIVTTVQGRHLKAPLLLNAAGAWAGTLAAQFGDPIPLVSNHPAMAVTEPVPFFIPWSLGVQGGGAYCRQVTRGNVVLGGGRGFAQDALRARSSHQAILAQFRQIVQLVPKLAHVNIIRTWSGVEGYLPDKQPVIDLSRQQAGLFHAFGFSGAGFQIGPAVGEVMADLMMDGHTSTPIDVFAIDRFTSSSATTTPDTPDTNRQPLYSTSL